MLFNIIKFIHVGCAILSLLGFIVRGAWMMQGSGMLAQKWVKIVPHIVDTLLLATAISLLFFVDQYPFADSWLTAKVIGLVIYIALGMVALRFGKTMQIKASAWLAAIGIYLYVLAVAMTKNPTILF